MATLVLSAAGAAMGAGFGGSVLGLSGAVIGRAVGATIGRSIDQRILGSGSEAVEQGRVSRFQLSGASDGAALARVWGRMRVGGQVIWASRFQETTHRSGGGGKGAPRSSSTSFSYSVSLAIALCQGPAQRVGRIWADGIEIAVGSLDLRFYPGDGDQLPDPKIEAVEGAGLAPSYRGVAYVVIEDLDLSRFGNRVPQFSFEVICRAVSAQGAATDMAGVVQAVALIPGTGEYALATTKVSFEDGPGVRAAANVHSVEDKTDFSLSLQHLEEELPRCGSVSLVVSWFGDDLRCAQTQIMPKVDQNAQDGAEMPWAVAGVTRGAAQVLAKREGRAIYGGTPADRAVGEAIAAIKDSGKEVMFYPFILMEQIDGNGLADPWSEAESQPVLPWRGRITLAKAPGQTGSADRSALAQAEVSAFMGTASVEDFRILEGQVGYAGPQEWRYRRFILHYAHLCALAGGVDAFCIGSEMRGLTQVRGAADSFPMVAALRQLAAEVRQILGPDTKITYAADWSEYFGYQADGNHYFHLDPLWADPNIDFVGIDNYMPLSDWRDGNAHLDASWGSIYNLEYLKANIAGGEGFDWYYDSAATAAAQLRRPIVDAAYGEDWIYRPKDLVGWWGNAHHNRIGGVREAVPTGWRAGMKPIRFTEYGCAALDKGTNEPNRFLDAQSSESGLPRASNGRRDDFLQGQYFVAMHQFWSDPSNNPAASAYAGRMVDLARCHAWAWDARPFPEFPGNNEVWGDGDNYDRGHWLNGRSTGQPLSAVVQDICDAAGVGAWVKGDAAYGLVRGYGVTDTGTGRSALQPLMTAYAMDVAEREGALTFHIRDGVARAALEVGRMAQVADLDSGLETVRAAEAESSGRVRVTYIEAENDFAARTAEAIFPDETSISVTQSDVALQLTNAEARAVTERWLVEARVARDGARFALPKSALGIGAGDVVDLDGVSYRIDRLETGDSLLVDAVRVEPGAYLPAEDLPLRSRRASPAVSLPVFPLFMDLPLLSGGEVPHAPHIAATASPWPGPVALWSAASADGFRLNQQLEIPAVMGVTQSVMLASSAAVWDKGAAVRVKLSVGALSSASVADVLNGANVAVIGDGSAENWEVFQFVQADLVAPKTYDLRLRLRGQAGSDGVMPQVWPVGSYFLLMDSAVPQIDLALAARGLARTYRVGQANLGYGDKQAVSTSKAFSGIGLRPYSVAHLRAVGGAGGTIGLSWVRRTRVEGDSWFGMEVPLGEDEELYQVQVLQPDRVVRQEYVGNPRFSYSASMQVADGVGAAFSLSVAQMSGRFGAGPAQQISFGEPVGQGVLSRKNLW